LKKEKDVGLFRDIVDNGDACSGKDEKEGKFPVVE